MCNTNSKLMLIADSLFESALFFNRIVDGKSLKCDNDTMEFSSKELKDKIKSQYLIALEEVIETETALDNNDEIEVYDGYCDVFYTCDILFYMLDLYGHHFGLDRKSACAYFNNDGLGKLVDKYDDLIEKANQLDLDILEEYANRVIDNNMEKFTTEQDEFEMWKATDVSHIPTSSVVDGVRYYFFIDANNKVKKRRGFPKVAVEDLFNGKK